MKMQAEHDPGGKVRMKMQPGVSGGALMSPCGRYRTMLSRRWGDGPHMLSVGMNPSTADSDVDDPTIRRDIALARREGCGVLLKVNVMDYRATSPAALLAPGVRPCSGGNLETILRHCIGAHRVVLSFGAIHPSLRQHARNCVSMLQGRFIAMWCLGTTADGSPRHPLYVKGDTPLQLWNGWN